MENAGNSGSQYLKRAYEGVSYTQRLLGAGCGESRTSGFEGEARRSNADADSN